MSTTWHDGGKVPAGEGQHKCIAKSFQAMLVCPRDRIVAGETREGEGAGIGTFSARMVIKPAARDRNGAVGNRKASVVIKATTAVARTTFMVGLGCAKGCEDAAHTWG